MKKVLSILLSVMMVAGLFAALIPTASALSYEDNVPNVVKKEILYFEDFEDESYQSLSGADLRAAFGWTASSDAGTGETSTPAAATTEIVETDGGNHVVELYSGGTWSNTCIFSNEKLAGGDYMIEYTQKMISNLKGDGQGIGFVSNGKRYNNGTANTNTAWQVNLKERGNWDTLAYYKGSGSRVDICEDIDYDPSNTTSDNGLSSNGSIVDKEIRVRIVIDADFGMTIYTLENGAWTMQATMKNESTVSAWAEQSSYIGNQILMRLINGPTIQLDDIEIATIEDYNGPTVSMVGVQTTFPDEKGNFDVRFTALLTQIEDFSKVKSVHYEISYAGEGITASANDFETKNVYLSYVYKTLTSNLGSTTMEAVDNAYYAALHITGCKPGVTYKVKPVITFTDNTTLTGNTVTYQPEALLENIDFMHFSFDDGYTCFNNLANNNYDSLFDEPFFGWMKNMHDKYGAIFSVYAFNAELATFAASANAEKYREEFQAAKSWLKLGLHSPLNDQNANFGTDKGTTYSTFDAGYEQWYNMLSSVMTVTGDKECLDLIPRLHNCAGTTDAIGGMIAAGADFAKDTADETDTAEDYRPMGFLAADDTRSCYDLGSVASTWLNANDHLTDKERDLYFLATDIRAEYAGSQCTKGSAYDELIYRHTASNFGTKGSSMIIFSHENRIQKNLDGVKEFMESAAKFAKDFDITFAFPQDRTYTDTPMDIQPAPDPEPTPTPNPGTGSNQDSGTELPEIPA